MSNAATAPNEGAPNGEGSTEIAARLVRAFNQAILPNTETGVALAGMCQALAMAIASQAPEAQWQTIAGKAAGLIRETLRELAANKEQGPRH